MPKFKKELIHAIAKEWGLRAYDYDNYVLVLDTMGEELKCKNVQELLDWLGK